MAASNAQIAYVGLQPTDMIAVPFPITHIGGIMLLTAYSRVGARVLLIETFDPATSPKVMSDLGTTIYGSATPFFLTYLAAQRAHGDEPFFPTLRQLHAGGAPITPELNAACLAVFGTPIFNQWGLTEFPAATSLGDGDPPEKFEGTVGRIAPGAEVKVVDFDGIDADGFVRITGRLKDIIIRNAENLSAQEIENVLVEHPAVADVAVIGLPDQRTGERACAVVVLAAGHDSLTVPELAEHCRAKGLAKQKIPEQLEIVTALPRNPMGKVLKHVLRAEVGMPS
jgi:acyl-CoA synthetase (AMP-forming)/AMP-acid ligase II